MSPEDLRANLKTILIAGTVITVLLEYIAGGSPAETNKTLARIQPTHPAISDDYATLSLQTAVAMSNQARKTLNSEATTDAKSKKPESTPTPVRAVKPSSTSTLAPVVAGGIFDFLVNPESLVTPTASTVSADKKPSIPVTVQTQIPVEKSVYPPQNNNDYWGQITSDLTSKAPSLRLIPQADTFQAITDLPGKDIAELGGIKINLGMISLALLALFLAARKLTS